jgi:hypothetical protein
MRAWDITIDEDFTVGQLYPCLAGPVEHELRKSRYVISIAWPSLIFSPIIFLPPCMLAIKLVAYSVVNKTYMYMYHSIVQAFTFTSNTKLYW